LKGRHDEDEDPRREVVWMGKAGMGCGDKPQGATLHTASLWRGHLKKQPALFTVRGLVVSSSNKQV